MRLKFVTCALMSGVIALTACSDKNDQNNAAAAKSDVQGDYTKAADALIAKMKAAPNGQLPGASDPAVQAFETQSQRAMQALGTAALPIQGFDSYDALCGKAATIVQGYVSAGSSPGVSGDAATAQMNANMAKYMDVLFTPLLFAAHCSASHMPFIRDTLSSEDLTGKVGDGFQQVRSGAYAQASGLLEMAASNDIGADRRGKILDMMASDAGKFAIVLSPDQRKGLEQEVAQAAAAVPKEGQAKLDTIKSEIEKAPCEKLCSA